MQAVGCSRGMQLNGKRSSPLGNGRMTTLVNGPERRVDDGWCMEAATTKKGLQIETPKPQLSRQQEPTGTSELPNEVC